MNATLHSSGGVNKYHDFKLATNPPIVATMTLEEAAALNANPYPDFRYVFVNCVTCGRRLQMIDFGGNPHAYLCATPTLPVA